MKPELAQFAEPLVRKLLAVFERRHRIYASFGDADSTWSPDGRNRSAIEPHEQDDLPDAVSVMIDILRDCLVHLSSSRPELFPLLLRELTECDLPLQRRLAIHIVNTNENLKADEKLAWLVDAVALDDLAAHHEIYSVLFAAFPAAGSEMKEQIVNMVMGLGTSSNDSDEQTAQTDRLRYDLLGWLKIADPDCEFVKIRFSEMQASHTRWALPLNADFTRYSTGGWVIHDSPWTKEQLLSKHPDDWLKELLEYQGDEFAHTQVTRDSVRVVDRTGLRDAVVSAIRENHQWGISLARTLCSTENWSTDIWKGLFEAWDDWNGDAQVVEVLFDVLLIPQCHSSHPREVSRLLKSYVEALWKGENEVLPRHFVRANGLAFSTWNSLPRPATMSDEDRDWSLYAINNPSGFLVQFWVRGHDYSIRRNTIQSADVASYYQNVFDAILSDTTEVGGAGRNILCHYVAYLLSALPDWTTTNLIPLFSSDDNLTLRQAWQGLLTSGKLGPKLWTVLKSDTLNMAKRLNVLEKSNQHINSHFNYIEQFEKLYAACVCFYVDAPLEEWIPTFYRHTNGDAHARLAMWIGGLIADVDENRRKTWWQGWMRSHWNNRNQGQPRELRPTEAGNMMNWLKDLGGVFQDAVSIAVQTPKSKMQYSSLFYRLSKSDLPERFPDDMARLLLHLLKDYSEADYWDYHGAAEIGRKILPRVESIEIKQKIQEMMLKCRFSIDE